MFIVLIACAGLRRFCSGLSSPPASSSVGEHAAGRSGADDDIIGFRLHDAVRLDHDGFLLSQAAVHSGEAQRVYKPCADLDDEHRSYDGWTCAIEIGPLATL